MFHMEHFCFNAKLRPKLVQGRRLEVWIVSILTKLFHMERTKTTFPDCRFFGIFGPKIQIPSFLAQISDFPAKELRFLQL